MLDVASLLDPANGLVTDVAVMPPSPDGNPLWRVALDLACEHAGEPADGHSLLRCSAGACSPTRTRAMVRAAGEAVERIALHGGPRGGDVVATAADLGAGALDFWAPEICLAGDPGDRPLRWYPATRLRDGAPSFVPAGLVEYPGAPEEADLFDSGPSGAAAGLGRDRALHGALLETVERDAVIVAWARQQRLARVDVDSALAGGAQDREWAHLERSVALVRAAGLEPVFARIPLGIDGLVCVTGGVTGGGTHHELLSLGAKVAAHPAAALYGALHESLQLHGALRLFESSDVHRAVVADETERVRFLASDTGSTALRSWLSDPVSDSWPPAAGAAPLTTDELVRALIADGLDPYLVDLTDRLPERVRRQGWSVVKVVPVGYQPLRIDERTAFGWNQRRLRSLEQRTGVAARLASDTRCPLPHPLP